MPRTLPSLNAVRAFECAARHGNFTRAADELHVTQGAVSRQIKLLEEQLGHRLFRRAGPKIELTGIGAKYHAVVQEGLGVLRRGTQDLLREISAPSLTISVLPSFAAKWLVPKMAEFQSRVEALELRVAASYKPVDFNLNPEFDAAIRLGKGDWGNGLYVEHLLTERLFPVCSPALAEGPPALEQPADLLRQTLLRSAPPFDDWGRWFAAAGLEAPAAMTGPSYSDAMVLLQAALEGQGVALARNLIVAGDLSSGRLVRLSDISIAADNGLYFVCPKGREREDRIRTFLDWLRAETCNTI